MIQSLLPNALRILFIMIFCVLFSYSADALVVRKWGANIRLEGGGAFFNRWERRAKDINPNETGVGFYGRGEILGEYRFLREGDAGYGIMHFGPYFSWSREIIKVEKIIEATRFEAANPTSSMGYAHWSSQVKQEEFDNLNAGITIGGAYKYHVSRDSSYKAFSSVSFGGCRSTIKRVNVLSVRSDTSGLPGVGPSSTDPNAPLATETVSGESVSRWGFCGDWSVGFGGGYSVLEYGFIFRVNASLLTEPESDALLSDEVLIIDDGTTQNITFEKFGASKTRITVSAGVGLFLGFAF